MELPQRRCIASKPFFAHVRRNRHFRKKNIIGKEKGIIYIPFAHAELLLQGYRAFDPENDIVWGPHMEGFPI